MSVDTLGKKGDGAWSGDLQAAGSSPVRAAGWAFGGLFVALAGALVITVLTLNPPASDLRDLMRFLLISGGASVLLGAAGFRLGLGTRIPSLSVTLAIVYLVGVAVVGINVLYTALNMFFSAHDLGLLIILLIFSAVISLFFAYFLGQSMVSRLRRLLVVARRVAQGDLSLRIATGARDEIGRLSEEFDSMVAQLEGARSERDRLEGARRNLVAAVSHDLRTPLAGIRAMVEAINDGVATEPATVSRYLHAIQGETIHLTALIDDLFELSQIDAGALTLHLEPAALEDLVSDSLESMAAQAQRKGVSLEGDVRGDIPRVLLDAPRMQRVLYNLIGNAIRYAPPGSTITVALRGEGERVALEVIDRGEGIPEADLPHVFDSFYRGEPARTREGGSSGAGLGLAIAKGIVEAHGGAIDAVSTPGQGATFRVLIPAGAPAVERAAQTRLS